jgi:hypothetical protein
MLRRLRASRRVYLPFAIAISAMVLLGTVDWWHADDEDGVTIAAFHNHAAHHFAFRALRSLKAPAEHCFVCHWLRTFHSGLRISASRLATLSTSPLLQPERSTRPSDLVTSQLPARAPPA